MSTKRRMERWMKALEKEEGRRFVDALMAGLVLVSAMAILADHPNAALFFLASAAILWFYGRCRQRSRGFCGWVRRLTDAIF